MKEDFILKIDGKIIGEKENYLTLRYIPGTKSNIGIGSISLKLKHSSTGKIDQLEYGCDFDFDWNDNRIDFKIPFEHNDELRVIYTSNGELSSPSLFHYFGVAKKNDAWTQENKFTSMF